jgi:hypothetical protein
LDHGSRKQFNNNNFILESLAAYLLLNASTGYSDELPERLSMKKNEFSEIASSLLAVGSVSVAIAPFLLGDRLGLVISGLMRDGAVLMTQFSNYLTWLVS